MQSQEAFFLTDIFLHAAADELSRGCDQVLYGHLLPIFDPLAVEDRSDRRKVGEDQVVLVDVLAESASVALGTVGHDLLVDPVSDMLIAAAA